MEYRGRILVVDDEASLRLLLSRELSREGYDVVAVADAQEALRKLGEESFHVALLDIVMPGMDGIELLGRIRQEATVPEVIMLTGNATVENAIECMKLGAFEYVRKPYSLGELLLHIERAISHMREQRGIQIMREELRRSGHRSAIIGRSTAMQRLRRLVARVAQTNATVLIVGQSGTGKEVTARAIHGLSARRDMPFVAINCASFSETLLESELFGHEKGAFTDAKAQKRGLAEMADGGTLFLDEVGEIPLRFQARLLRFLETGEIRRVGGIVDIRLDVRILCATNQPLEDLLRARRFRDDLYYRLNVLSITVAPLREHKTDIVLLVQAFLAQMDFQKTFDDEALRLLQEYDWPGNVRELRNVVERVCIMTTSRRISAADLAFIKPAGGPSGDAHGGSQDGPEAQQDASPMPSLSELQRQHIVRVLAQVGGHKTQAASILGISTKTLYNKMKAYRITSQFR